MPDMFEKTESSPLTTAQTAATPNPNQQINQQENLGQERQTESQAPAQEVPTETVNVSIMGYNQKLTCRQGEAALFEEAARRVEASLLELRKNVPSFSLERVAILTALDICHEMLLKELQLEEFSNIVKTRSAKIKDLLAKIEGAY